jgi:hypothetical protein
MANPAAAEALQNALNNHDRVRKSTDLPLFFGRKDKETITPNVLVDRLQRAAGIAGWNTDARKCTEFYMILRDKALGWWDSLEDTGVNIENWEQVKTEFLRAYAPKFTARTTCTNFQELVQKSGETVQDYYLRVVEAFKRMCEAKPATINDVRADRGAATVEQAAAMKKEGIVDTERFFKHQLFIAGLREDLRMKIMEAGKDNLKETLDLARELEVIMNDRNRKSGGVAPIGENEEENAEENSDMTEEEISAINAIRERQGRPPIRFGRRDQNNRKGRNDKKKDARSCRYCHLTGHMQQKCRKRIAAGAPCVDENGKPWANQPGKVHQVAESAGQASYSAPPPPPPQPSYASHYGGATATISGQPTGGYDPYHLNW